MKHLLFILIVLILGHRAFAQCVITSQPTSVSLCDGLNTSFSCTVSGTGLSYTWQLSTDGGSTWANISNSTTYSGVNTSTLGITSVSLSMSGYKYRDSISGSCGTTTSNNATLIVYPIPTTPTFISSNSPVCEWDTLNLYTLHMPGVYYFWENPEVRWTHQFGYHFSVDTVFWTTASFGSDTGWWCIYAMNSSLCFSLSGPCTYIKIEVSPNVLLQSTNNSVCIGNNTYLSVNAYGSSYQWQVDTGGGFSNIMNGSGVFPIVPNIQTKSNEDTLFINHATLAMNGYIYRCIVSNSCGSDTSNVDTLVVKPQYTATVSMSYAPNDIVNFSLSSPCSNCSYMWAPISHFVQFFPAILVDTPAASGCVYLNMSGPINCPATFGPFCYTMPQCGPKTASFTISTSGLTAIFSDTATAPDTNQVLTYLWNFGDGATDTVTNPTHTYAASGSYSIALITSWMDTTTHSAQCADTTYASVSVGNIISGLISIDTASMNPANPTFKIWLIHFDSASNTLYAVDSTNDTGSNYTCYYQFINEPAGDYMVKAALTNGPSSGAGPMPTYGYDSLYWHGATHIIHTAGVSSQNIRVLQGVVTSGPGFIGGNVSLGANKGTKTSGAPAENMLIFLGDVNNHPLAYTYTDANGNYSFINLPIGFYVIYPDELNYTTIPHRNIFVDNGHLIMNSISFHKNAISKTITPFEEAINNIGKSNDVRIYPNPGSGIFNLVWNKRCGEQVAFIITDVLGQTVYTKETNEPTESINLSHLPAGVYYLHIRSERMNYTTKLVLKK